MEMRINNDDTARIIEEYYKKYEERKIKAKIESKKGTCGYGMGEMDTCYTDVIIEEEVEVLGIKTKITETIPENNLLGIFKIILEDSGYDVESAKFDDGITSAWDSCYRGEYQASQIYCNGIILQVKKNAKQKTIGGK